MAFNSLTKITRKTTRKINIKDVEIGGDAPISVQTMTNTITSNPTSTLNQIETIEKAGADSLTVQFVGTLAANGRLSALLRVIRAFLEEHARRRGQVSAEVISAVPLDDRRKASVEKTVARLAGSDKLSLSMRVDSSLIGGLVVRIGSRMIDTSIKTKLSRLESAMKGVA